MTWRVMEHKCGGQGRSAHKHHTSTPTTYLEKSLTVAATRDRSDSRPYIFKLWVLHILRQFRVRMGAKKRTLDLPFKGRWGGAWKRKGIKLHLDLKLVKKILWCWWIPVLLTPSILSSVKVQAWYWAHNAQEMFVGCSFVELHSATIFGDGLTEFCLQQFLNV